MDKALKNYVACVKQLLGRYEGWQTEWATAELVFDDARHRYMVMLVGWLHGRRIHRCLIHIDVVGDKLNDDSNGERNDGIVIQANNTEDELDIELVKLGIPAEKIYLGLLPPAERRFANLPVLQQELQSA